MPMDRTVHEYHQLLIPEVLSREHHFPLIEVEGRHVTYIAIGTDFFFPNHYIFRELHSGQN